MRGSHFLVLLSLLLFTTACNEARSRSCTNELRSAIVVAIESPHGLLVDSVTAKHRVEDDCSATGHSGLHGGIDGGSDTFTYNCYEQAGSGDYLVRVTSGDLVWTRTVAVDDDGCHAAQPAQTVTFVLDPKTAD
jgi:hypothetical protein